MAVGRVGQAGQHSLAGLVTILIGRHGRVERAADEFRAEEIAEIRNVAERIRRPAVLPENGFLIVPHFLALALTGFLLIFIVRDSEVGALQRAGHANDVFVGGEPVGAQIERDVASVCY